MIFIVQNGKRYSEYWRRYATKWAQEMVFNPYFLVSQSGESALISLYFLFKPIFGFIFIMNELIVVKKIA